MGIEARPFGLTRLGLPVECYTLSNSRGIRAEVLTYGGILRCLYIPVGGGLRDVVLGFDNVSDYEGQDKYIGALIGRAANRIGGASFALNGQEYFLTANNGPNCLHGGEQGFHKKVWAARSAEDTLVLSCFSPDGEEGFPRNLKTETYYSLTDDNELVIEFLAECDADTIVNLTSHSYFNLRGHNSGGIEEHTVQIFAGSITEIDENSTLTGRLIDVTGTPFDFRSPKNLMTGLASGHPQIRLGAGYDHNFILKPDWDDNLRLAAVIEADGLRMECLTTQPGLQLYTANYLSGERGKDGAFYNPRCALCLETQNWPDAIRYPHFPDCVLRKGETYRQITAYRFSEIG